MSDLTLISKVSNEAINDNLKKRFENREIYVSTPGNQPSKRIRQRISQNANLQIDIYWSCAGLC